MDYLQFTSSVVSALAWPTIIGYFLFLLRKQIIPLAQRLTEVSLPGGAKALFREELEGAKDQALRIAVSEKKDRALVSSSSKENGRSGRRIDEKLNSHFKPTTPETIWDVYDKTEEYMKRKIQRIPLELRRVPADFVFYDLKPMDGGQELYDMYRRIQEISQTSRRGFSLDVDRQDVKSYRDICNLYLRRFDDIMKSWIENQPGRVSEFG